MFKTIFVPASGNDTDDRVFATALALARPFGAHLRFFHLRLSACEAALRSRHVEFCSAPAMTDALRGLEERDNELSAKADKQVNAFCAANDIPVRSIPGDSVGVSAQFFQETDHEAARFISHSRHSDLIVMGRPHAQRLDAFRPDRTTPAQQRTSDTSLPLIRRAASMGTIVIGWKETPEAARAVGAAMPLLQAAEKVVIVHVAEADGAAANDLNCSGSNCHGMASPRECARSATRPRMSHSVLAATASEFGADLLVVGGYGHGPWREAVFGGVTTTLINHAEYPVFMMH